MKKNSLVCSLLLLLTSLGFAQVQTVNEKLKDYFSAVPFHSDIEVVRSQLGQNEEFKFYEDPNRDRAQTIIGTFIKNKRLNPSANGNQLIIQYSGRSVKKKNVLIKWSVNYKLEDLSIAMNDFENLIAEFKPYFVNIIEKKGVGQHKEESRFTILKNDPMVITIRMVEYNNFIHTVSFEYQDVWKLPANKKKRK